MIRPHVVPIILVINKSDSLCTVSDFSNRPNKTPLSPITIIITNNDNNITIIISYSYSTSLQFDLFSLAHLGVTS